MAKQMFTDYIGLNFKQFAAALFTLRQFLAFASQDREYLTIDDFLNLISNVNYFNKYIRTEVDKILIPTYDQIENAGNKRKLPNATESDYFQQLMFLQTVQNNPLDVKYETLVDVAVVDKRKMVYKMFGILYC